MSVSLRFDCPTRNETVRRAVESYVGVLEKALEQYWNLWEDYVKLQEKHEQCNVHPSSTLTIDEPCTRTRDTLTPQRQLDSRTIVQENESPSLLELGSLHTDCLNFDSDMDANAENLTKSREDADSPSKSPVFSRKYLRTGGGASAKKLYTKSSKAISLCSDLDLDAKTHRIVEVAPSKCRPKLEISTTHHVETTFLPDGKRLKQSRLVFHPFKHDERKLSLPNVNKVGSSSSATLEAGQDLANISAVKAPVATKNTVTKKEETSSEDVIEISPTQRSVIKSKLKHRLKLKRRSPVKRVAKDSSNKNTRCSSERKAEIEIIVDDVDFGLCPSPEYATQVENEDKPSAKDANVVGALKDKINTRHYSSTEARKEDRQSAISKAQGIVAEKDASNFDEEETFYLPAERAANKRTDTDDFDLNDETENKPPAKKILLDKLDTLPKRRGDIPEQLNARCKADRAKLNGWDCWECEEYYKNLSLPKEELQKRKNQCSRHRHRYERPNTPEGFWDPEFPATLSCTYRQNAN